MPALFCCWRRGLHGCDFLCYQFLVETDDDLSADVDDRNAHLTAHLYHFVSLDRVSRNVDFLERNIVFLEVNFCQVAVRASRRAVDFYWSHTNIIHDGSS